MTVADAGDSVSLTCPAFDNEGQFFHWFKQPVGFTPHIIGAGVLGSIRVTEQFKEPRFTITKGDKQNLLTIGNVSKQDEAIYFCQTGSAYTQTVANGTFLAVRGNVITTAE